MKKSHFYNYIGILNIVFIVMVIVISNYLSNGVDYRLNPISALGADPNGGVYFNIGLIFFSIWQVLFGLVVCHQGDKGIRVSGTLLSSTC